MGSASILRKYAELDHNYPIPLTLAHGVDFECDSRVADIDSPEPIYWSTNIGMHNRASSYKESILLPHPWIILDSNREDSHKLISGSNLIVAPPPGPENDKVLLDTIIKNNIKSPTILLKKRGNTTASEEFWTSNGINFISAGDPDGGFYSRLYEIMRCHENVIGCNLSSALFFAASINKTCRIMRGVTIGFLIRNVPQHACP
jgi:hypothetical protein